MEKSEKRIWTKGELTIAYYIAKWDMNGLALSEQALVECVIGNTTVNSLRKQVANFRFLLGIEGYQLEHASTRMSEVVEDLKNKTVTQVRSIIQEIVDQSESEIAELKSKQHNREVERRRIKANEFYQKEFDEKLRLVKKHKNKNLRHVGTRLKEIDN